MKKIYQMGMVIFAFLLVLGLGTSAHAGVFQIEDENSIANIDTESQLGVYDWIVDGDDILFKQWFWYSVDGAAEQSVDNLNIDVEGTSDTDFDGDDDTLFVRYMDGATLETSTFSIEIRLFLTGGSVGSDVSDLGEIITINNLTDASLDFSFYQYADFDLNNPNDTVVLSNANTVLQTATGFGQLSETVLAPAGTFYELATFGTTITKLNDGLFTTLSNTASPTGPGDVTWAFQWNTTVAANGSFQISKDKNFALVIPEPATLGLFGLGLIGLGLLSLRRRRRAIPESW